MIYCSYIDWKQLSFSAKDTVEVIAWLLRFVAGIGVIVAGSQAQEISCCSFGR